MAEATKPTKARAPRASALKSTEPRKTAKRQTPDTAPPATVVYTSKYTVGDQVSHPMFGDGTVMTIHANKLTIEFPDSVIKQILDDYVNPRQRRRQAARIALADPSGAANDAHAQKQEQESPSDARGDGAP